MKRQTLDTIVVVSSLVLSMVSCLIIGAFVIDELGVDKSHKNINEIVLFRQFENSPLSGGQFATDFKLGFPQVKQSVRMKPMNLLVAGEKDGYYEPEFYFADPAVFDVFSFNWIVEPPKQVLEQSNAIVISNQIAAKYFGDTNPIGKTLKVNGKQTLIVQGIYGSSKERTHIKPALIASYKIANEMAGFDVTTNYWGPGSYTYLLIDKGADMNRLSSLLATYIQGLNDPNAAYVWKPSFIPLKDLYLKTSLFANSPITYVYIFSGAALLLLLLAGFNYINLSTAGIASRQKAVAIKKILGISVTTIRAGFMLEAGIYFSFSIILALVVAWIVLPLVNLWTGFELSLRSLATIPNILTVFAFLFGLIFFSGFYPAIVYSSASPVNAIKGSKSFCQSKNHLRKVLIVGQFAVSFIMVLVTMVINRQMQFVATKNVGYNREQVLSIDLRDVGEKEKLLFKNAVLDLPQVDAASICYAVPGSNISRGQKMIDELVPIGSSDASIMQLTIDAKFSETFGVPLVMGRMLDESKDSDKIKFMVNETAMKKFGWTGIEGKFAGYYTYSSLSDGSYKEVPLRGEVVGVLADYNHNDLKSPIKPTIYTLNDGYESAMGIKIKANSLKSALPAIQQKWKSYFPDRPISYTFLDDTFNKNYAKEIQTGKVFAAFSGITIFISCLGLFGLVFFALQRRQKELSIRKVLGAGVGSIIATVSKEFFALILLASAIGLPLAWYGINKWLENFSFRIYLDGWTIFWPMMILLGLVSVTIGWNVLKAAIANPVKNLRSE
jgi:putative ABC transport system permease protein